MLVDNGSSVNIIFGATFDKMEVDHELSPINSPLFGFTGDSIVPRGKITLAMEIGAEPLVTRNFMEFLVVDSRSAYHGVLGRPALKELCAVTSIHHLCMKFPTDGGVATVRGDQRGSRECYSNSLRKAEPRTTNVILNDVDMEELPEQGAMPMPRDVLMTEAPEKGTTVEKMTYLEELDPRIIDCEPQTAPMEELETFPIDTMDPSKYLQVGSKLPPKVKEELKNFLVRNLDVFAWKHGDMVGIDPRDSCHHLNIDPKATPHRQKRRALNPERYEALREEVKKLIDNGFVRESMYPKWVSNPVLVKKHNGKWRVCIDFSNLNQACPKDSFPLPRIDQLVDATAGHEILSFMDAYSGYNQIPMFPPDEEHTSFVTDKGLYCYRAMPFGLKNAGATYQRLVNKMFVNLIGRTMEVYVDDMLVKSLRTNDHVTHLCEMFQILRKHQMKLNPLKCAFGVSSGKFLGYIVNRRGIEANPEKVKALIEMRSPKKPKEVQSLTGRVAALSRFISKATDKCQPFFKILKGGNRFQWTDECEAALQELKKHLGQPHLLSKPKDHEVLYLYLSVTPESLSSVLIREEGEHQLPVYYVSKALIAAETRYPDMEKLALSLITASRKLRPYFQAHSIHVLTNYPLKQVLQKPDASGRLLKWAVELSEFDIHYKPKLAIKGQALADFVAEFTPVPSFEVEMEPLEPQIWRLSVDGSAGETGSGAGVVLTSPEGHKLNCAVRFGFKATNNAAEYEALLAGLRLAREMQVKRLIVNSDSQLVVSQVHGNFSAKDKSMAAYLKLVMSYVPSFERFELMQIPRSYNSHADALAKLASSKDSELLNVVPIEHLLRPSIEVGETVMWTEGTPPWMTPIMSYLKDQTTIALGKEEAQKLRRRAAHFVLQDDVLYKRGFSMPLLRCIGGEQADYVLREIHEGVCGNHAGGWSLAQKTLRQGYYWPTLKKDAQQFVKKCDKCQRFATVQRQPSQELNVVSSPWPFAKWGVDLIGPLPRGKGNSSFAIVAIDYFTKWVEAEPLAKITEANTSKFLWKNIICRFGIPHSIVTDNGKQFDNKKVREMCEELGIKKHFSSPHHPQANGQVEAVNKTIKYTLKRKLDASKGAWVEELPQVLWAIRTTSRTATGETPFSMTYGAEAMSPVEVGLPSPRRMHYNETVNDEARCFGLDLLEERRDESQEKMVMYQRKMTRYYNSKVKKKAFRLDDLVLRRVFPPSKEHGSGTLGPNWEGPYRVCEEIRPGTYKIKNMDGRVQPHPWNVEHLRKYYQ
jgi:ribonuclease HI